MMAKVLLMPKIKCRNFLQKYTSRIRDKREYGTKSKQRDLKEKRKISVLARKGKIGSSAAKKGR